MRIKVAEQWIGNASQAFRPGGQAGNAVHTKTQNLGLDPFKPVQNGLVRRDLARSDRRPGQWEEGQHDILLVAKIADPDGATEMAFQTDIRGRLTDVKGHKALQKF